MTLIYQKCHFDIIIDNKNLKEQMFSLSLTANIYSVTIKKKNRCLKAGGTKMNKHIVIKSKLRLTIFLVIMMLLAVTMINTVLGMNEATGNTEKSYIKVEVAAGDTLWDIADIYADDSVDMREAVYQICKINDIKAGDLKEGMTLSIPEEF